MAVDIGPKIGLDGEKEFRQQLTNINQQLKTLGSEMKAVTAEFMDSADSQDAMAAKTGVLTKQISAQEKKVEELRKGLAASAEKFGDNDTRTLRWKQAVYDANAELSKMRTQLDKTGNEMEDFGEATDEAGGFLNKIKSFAGSDLGGALLGGLGVGAAAAGVKSLAESLMGLEESTREYRRIMGSLEISSQNAGYAAEETKEVYLQLYGVLGDTQSAATTTANLQAIGLAQSDLVDITNAAIGAWATYGDSIPIDSLAESINETIQAGKVTGTFADVLNWAGTSEDEFNLRLEQANSSTERANIVLQELASQGLIEAGTAWQQVNKDIVDVNTANAELEEAWGRLGEVIAPLTADIINFAADALGFLITKLTEAIELFKTLAQYRSTVPAGSIAENYSPYIDGSFATGLSRVPFDGFIAELHKDEMILPADQASALRSLMTSSGGNNQTDFAQFAAGIVGGLQTAMEGAGGSYRIEIPIIINGREFSRGILPDLRAAMKADPEVVSG